LFPRLSTFGYRAVSAEDTRYNCIAWAAQDVRRWWWPDVAAVQAGVCHWPTDAAVAETLDAFIQAFQTLGYQPCEEKEPEPGHEKVAIYMNSSGKPTHAARQLTNGRWTSKLGIAEDIEHSLDGLEGELYGTVAQILKRPILMATGDVRE
jgi:hypothetical protein